MKLTKRLATLFILIHFLFVWHSAFAQPTPQTDLPLQTSVRVYKLNNDVAVMTLSILMAPEWYTYGNTPGDMGKPTQLSGYTADGKHIIPLYPDGKLKSDSFDPSLTINTFTSGTNIYVPLPLDDKILPVTLRLELLLCHPTRCVPVRKDIQFNQSFSTTDTLPLANKQPWWPEFEQLSHKRTMEVVVPSSGDNEESKTPQIPQWSFTPQYLQPALEVSGIFSAILMGLLAGLILNIMPCVLPVVSLKLSALLNSSSMKNETERISAFREHNIFFALGVLTFFLVLAIILGGTGQAWGALFQNKWLVFTIGIIIFILSLSLFGLFHLPVIDLKFGVESNNPRIQAFFTGNLTTLLATPCSGPFLGGVLSWALVRGPLVIATVFISIGIGMASPYILMVMNPNLSRYLPKSGPWIEYVEKGIAFFLIGTAFYLLSIAIGSNTLAILGPAWAIIFGVWLWIKTRHTTGKIRWGIRIASIALIIGLTWWTTPPKSNQTVWEEYNTEELSKALGNENIFLDFTADWCPTCKVLEATVLTPDNINKWKSNYRIRFIKVDMTERDPEKEALLKALGSRSIPTAAIFPKGTEKNSPLVLRDLFTEGQLERALKSWKK